MMGEIEFWTCGCLYECYDYERIGLNGGTVEDIRDFHEKKDDKKKQ